MNNVKRLPYCYRKDPKSNNYRLLQLNESAVDELRQDIGAVRNMLDLNQAFGKTLNLYGAMLEQLRGPLTDDQFRHMLFAQIGRNNAKGDYASIVKALVMLFGTSLELITEADFELIEDERPCLVRLTRFPESLEDAGFSTRQMAQIIKSLLPICVTLLLQFYSCYDVSVRYDNVIYFQTSFHPRYNLPFLRFDRTWRLDGSRRMNGYASDDVLDFYPVGMRLQNGVAEVIRTEERMWFAWGGTETIKTESLLDVQVTAVQAIITGEQVEFESAAGIEAAAETKLGIVQEVMGEPLAGYGVCMQTAAGQVLQTGELVHVQAEGVYHMDTASFMTKMNQTDGTWRLDGSRKLDGGRYFL